MQWHLFSPQSCVDGVRAQTDELSFTVAVIWFSQKKKTTTNEAAQHSFFFENQLGDSR